MKSLRKYEKLAIISLVQELNWTGCEKVKLSRVKDRFKGHYYRINNGIGQSISHQTSDSGILKDTEATEILLRLQWFSIISISEETNLLTDKHFVELNLYKDEIKSALQNDQLLEENHFGVVF